MVGDAEFKDCQTITTDHFTLEKAHYNVHTTAYCVCELHQLLCVYTHSYVFLRKVTTVLVHSAVCPCDPSTHINGQCHLCVAIKAGDASWKMTVSPTTVTRAVVVSMYCVTVRVGIVRTIFVKAQPLISATMVAGCWYNAITASAEVHNLGWVE